MAAPVTTGELSTILQGYGIPAGPFQDLIRQAILNNWSPEELISQIYASPAFAAAYPNIVGPSGEFKMSPAEYLQARTSYMHTAERYGFTLTNAEFGKFIVGGDVSQQEFLDRTEAAARIDENPQFARAYKSALEATGVKVGTKEIFDAVLGMAPQQFYDVYEKTVIAGTAKLAGIGLNQKLVQQIQTAAPGQITESSATTQSFQQLAQEFRTVVPLGKAYSFGVTKSDLVQLEFGGPKQAQIAETVTRIMNQEKRLQEQATAHNQMYPTAQGNQTLGGYSERAQVQ